MKSLVVLFLTAVLLTSFGFSDRSYNFEKGSIPAPANVQASDGRFLSKINVTWEKIPNTPRVKYQVYKGETPDIDDMDPFGHTGRSNLYSYTKQCDQGQQTVGYWL